MAKRDKEYLVYNSKTGRRLSSIRTQYSLADARQMALDYAKKNNFPKKNLEIKRFS